MGLGVCERIEQKEKERERELIDVQQCGDYGGGEEWVEVEEGIEAINCD